MYTMYNINIYIDILNIICEKNHPPPPPPDCLDFENFMTSAFYDVTPCLLPLSRPIRF